MNRYAPDNIASLGYCAGWRGTDLITALAVAQAESGLDAEAVGGPNQDGSYDVGIWQLNGPTKPAATDPRFDPWTNAVRAFTLWRSRGWEPWTTYTGGAYLAGMPAAAAVVARVTPVPAGTCADIKKGGNAVPQGIDAGIGRDVVTTLWNKNPVADAIKGIDAVGHAALWLTDPHNWFRLGLAIAGGLLMLVALYVLVRNTPEVQQARETGGKVAMAAAAGA